MSLDWLHWYFIALLIIAQAAIAFLWAGGDGYKRLYESKCDELKQAQAELGWLKTITKVCGGCPFRAKPEAIQPPRQLH